MALLRPSLAVLGLWVLEKYCSAVLTCSLPTFALMFWWYLILQEDADQNDDIGHFGEHADSPGVAFLRRDPPVVNVTDTQALIHQLGGSRAATYESYTDRCLLSLAVRKRLMCLLDERHRSSGEPTDLKVDLSESELVAVIGRAAFSTLSGLFAGEFNQIKLRRVATKGQCINFHLDHSLRTMQVSAARSLILLQPPMGPNPKLHSLRRCHSTMSLITSVVVSFT